MSSVPGRPTNISTKWRKVTRCEGAPSTLSLSLATLKRHVIVVTLIQSIMVRTFAVFSPPVECMHEENEYFGPCQLTLSILRGMCRIGKRQVGSMLLRIASAQSRNAAGLLAIIGCSCSKASGVMTFPFYKRAKAGSFSHARCTPVPHPTAGVWPMNQHDERRPNMHEAVG